MAKIIYLNIPAHGHVNPTLPVVSELVKRGHQVIYLNAEEFRGKIVPTGVDFRPYAAPTPSSREIADLMAGGNIVNATVTLMRMTENLLPSVLATIKAEQPDLLIYDSTALWGMIAARLLRIPSLGSITTFVFDGAGETKPSLREMAFLMWKAAPLLPTIVSIRNRLTKQYSKDIFRKDGIFPALGDTNIAFTSRDLQPDTPLLKQGFHFVGPSINESLRGGDFPFEQITRKPVVYISMGTINNLNTEFYQHCFAAFGQHPGQFILSVGEHTDIGQLGKIPANFIVRNSVPQLAVLQHSDVFITHGGMNSVHEGLYYGVPLIVLPQQLEQNMNGRRVVARGAGLLLGEKPPFGRVTVEQLQQSLDTILSDEGYRTNARRISQNLRAAGGYTTAADMIEQRVKTETNLHVVPQAM